MNETNNKIDAVLRKEWHRNFRIKSIFVAIIILVILAVIAYSTGEHSEIETEVISIHSQASEYSERFYIITKLESGVVINLEIPRETQVKKGSKVILRERQTNLFGFKSYSFYKVEIW